MLYIKNNKNLFITFLCSITLLLLVLLFYGFINRYNIIENEAVVANHNDALEFLFMENSDVYLGEDERVFVPQQFENIDNLNAQKHHTAFEIAQQVAGPIHGFCSGIGTGGTLMGIAKRLKDENENVKIWTE